MLKSCKNGIHNWFNVEIKTRYLLLSCGRHKSTIPKDQILPLHKNFPLYKIYV